MSELFKRHAAEQAAGEVVSGMRLGIGTGSTAEHFVRALANRVRQGLDVIGVPTSERTRTLAQGLGIRLTTLEETPQLDLTIDAWNGDQPSGEGLNIPDRLKMRVEDEMPAIRDKRTVPAAAQFDPSRQRQFLQSLPDRSACRLKTEGNHLDGERKRAERLDQLAGIRNDNHSSGGGGRDFLTQ